MAERQASELLERLRKVLELERAKGFKDAAVYGGLDRFLERWATQAGNSEDSAAQELSRELGASGIRYRELDAAARARWVERALASLSGASAPSALRQAQGERETSVPVKSSRSLRSGSPPSVRGELVEPQIDSAPLSEPLAAMKGFGPQLAARFERLGVRTVQDVLYLFPRRHQDFSRLATVVELRPGQEQTIDARVWGCKEKRLSTGRRIVEATLYDDTGNVQVTWYNLGFLARELKPNTRVIISGRVGALRGRPHFEHPEYEIVDEETQELIHTGRLVPVYPATEGLRQRTLRRWVKRIVDQWSPAVRDFLPSRIRSKAGFLELAEAVRQAHYPDDLSKQDDARRRLAFDELFLMQLGILQRRKEWRQGQPGRAITVDQEALDAFLSSLPFTLTGSQQRVLDQVLRDIQRSIPMARLLQGEVGSGKTVVATAALMVTAAAKLQGAMMAPTEILAEQHFQTIRNLVQGMPQPAQGEHYFAVYLDRMPKPVTIGLLIGSMTAKQKAQQRGLLAEGALDILVGTHALIQEEVQFHELGLVVVDEQHRFGVEQRQALRQKGFNPHLLVMTATPIPRTLALTIYGDLDVSTLDQLPPGRDRRQVKTIRLRPDQRQRAYEFIRKQVQEGRQAFVVCPLIEESEALDIKAAATEYERLRAEALPDLADRIGLVHGRMSASEKDAVMRRMRSGELAVLVATPVIEVGVDVPNATVMLIEGAERFGLSQLHQLRGRVGRGGLPSYCLLLAESPSAESMERLGIVERTSDGFTLADEDLRLRGPGEFLGTRQHGLPDLRMARLSDVPLLEFAREQAAALFAEDPDLARPEHQALRRELERLWPQGLAEMS